MRTSLTLNISYFAGFCPITKSLRGDCCHSHLPQPIRLLPKLK